MALKFKKALIIILMKNHIIIISSFSCCQTNMCAQYAVLLKYYKYYNTYEDLLAIKKSCGR